LSEVNLPSFVTVVFETEAMEDEFGNILSEYETLMHKVEFLLIDKGIRKCDVEHIFPETLQQQLVLLDKAGYKYKALDQVKRFLGFSHYHQRPNGLFDSMIFGVVGKRNEDLEEFAKGYYAGDHRIQGRLLGYPDCCINAFIDSWSKKHFDPIVDIAERTGVNNGEVRGNPLLNVMLRYAGVRVIPFLPCTFTCKNAEKFAEHVLDIAKRENKSVLKKGLWLLSQKLEWSQVNGIIEVKVFNVMRIITAGYTSEPQKILFIPTYDASKLV